MQTGRLYGETCDFKDDDGWGEVLIHIKDVLNNLCEENIEKLIKYLDFFTKERADAASEALQDWVWLKSSMWPKAAEDQEKIKWVKELDELQDAYDTALTNKNLNGEEKLSWPEWKTSSSKWHNFLQALNEKMKFMKGYRNI